MAVTITRAGGIGDDAMLPGVTRNCSALRLLSLLRLLLSTALRQTHRVLALSTLSFWFFLSTVILSCTPDCAAAQNSSKLEGLVIQSASVDDAFLALREAIRVGDLDDAAALGQHILAIDPHYPLAAYIDYWPLSQRLHSVNDPPGDDVVRAFLAQNEGTLVADLARRDWLLALARRGDFVTFETELPKLQSRDDPQIACYALAARSLRSHNDGGNGSSDAMWNSALSVPGAITGEGCGLLLSLLSVDGRIPSSDLWDWVRLASDANLPVAMKRYAIALPTADTQAVLAFDAIVNNPSLWLARHANDRIASIQELWEIALIRMARVSPSDTAALFEMRYAHLMSATARSAVYAELAAAGFKRQLPEALDWARRGIGAPNLPEDVYASELRVALREGDSKLYLRLFENLPPEMKRAQSNDGGWLYWLARFEAHDAMPQANQLFSTLSTQFNFYGELAAEELGHPRSLPPFAAPASDTEIAQAASQPDFARAQRFYALNLRSLGNQEWNFPLKNMTDRQLLASSEYARRVQVLDRAISTADRTRVEHDFRLRFLTPYLDMMQAKASETRLDVPWVYGLIRQESRFLQVAKSNVGASGLMQLMPATAQYVAKKIGLADYAPDRVTDLDTNLTLGTNYLRLLLDQLDNFEVLATAGYDAGPGRPRNWRQALSHTEEGALFAETIPFPETRDYVKKVMSNSYYYGLVLHPADSPSLKTLMGTIGFDVNRGLPAKVQ